METDAINFTRELVVAVARSWVGTPYHHQASLKGIGCDCLGLIRGVWSEVTGLPHEAPPAYTPDWGEARREETMAEAARRHMDELDVTSERLGGALDKLLLGDVAMFRMVATGPAKHCGFVAERDGRRSLIHAWNQRSQRTSAVAEVDFDAGWANRIAYGFRFRGL